MQKVTVAIRTALLLNSTITGLVGSGTAARIYPQHIVTVNNPKYPAISMGRQGGGTEPHEIATEVMQQIDVWSKTGDDELWAIYNEIKATIQKTSNIKPAYSYFDTALVQGGVSLAECRETSVEGDLYEESTRTFHLAARYRIIAK